MVDRHMNTHTETELKYFDGHSRLSQSEESKKLKNSSDAIFVVCSHTFALF
jgi:hypothetical protein